MNFLIKSTSCFTNNLKLLMSFWLVQNPSFSKRFQTSWNDICSDIKLRKERSNGVDFFPNNGIGNALRIIPVRIIIEANNFEPSNHLRIIDLNLGTLEQLDQYPSNSVKINMRRFLLIMLGTMILSSCAPVLRRELMETAIRDVSISDIKNTPDLYKGKLFILGGSIANTKITEKGSLIEVVYIPVNSRGYLKDVEPSDGRFWAIFPKDKGTLDPLIYRKGRYITLAGEFVETRSGKIDEMEYAFPVFEIIEIYLWKEEKVYYPSYPYWWDYPYPYPYPYGWPYGWYYDPWWRPWGPSWRHPYWW